MVKKSVINQVGSFDPDFFLYFEETELCYRIYNNGYHVYNVPSAKIIHLEGASHESSITKLSFYNSSRRIFYRKRYNLIFYFICCNLFYAKCILGLLKNIIIFNSSKIRIWQLNIVSFYKIK